MKKKNFERINTDRVCSFRHFTNISGKAVNTSCYSYDRTIINKKVGKKNESEPNIFYFHIFEYKFYIHKNAKNHFSEFESNSDSCIFLGCSAVSKHLECSIR